MSKKQKLNWMEIEDQRLSDLWEAEEKERNRIFTEHIDGMESVVYKEDDPFLLPNKTDQLVKSLTRDVARLFLKLQDKERCL